MKKIILMMFCSIAIVQSSSADNDIETTDTSRLPAHSREFIRQHFPEVNISYIKIENSLFGISSYDVILENGFDLEFDKRGEWTEIDGQRLSVPEKIVPTAISDYQKKHFPNQRIVSIEKDSHGYDVQLSNDLEIEFSRKFKFIRYND